jgi:hypothetical protein
MGGFNDAEALFRRRYIGDFTLDRTGSGRWRRLYIKMVHKKGALQIAQPFSSTIIADLEKLLGEDCNGTRKHSRSEYQIRDYR